MTMLSNITALLAVLVVAVSGQSAVPEARPVEDKVISERQFSLANRYVVENVNEVMKKNILLNLAYFDGRVDQKSDIDWQEVTSPFHFEKVLEPGRVFAYHANVRDEYADMVTFTTNTRFNAADGYLTDGYLYGDGVCHLASLINWAAKDAGLETVVPKDHRSVGPIPDVPDEHGVSIYMNDSMGANNNLYVVNTKDVPVVFHFEYDGTDLRVYITEEV